MRLRNVKNAKMILEQSANYIKNPAQNKNKWSLFFQNNNPIHLEIGCGKGQYLIKMAETYPHINFIGLEKYESVLVKAIKKEFHLNNLYFLCTDAKNLEDIFGQEINTIYLNFSDPWPKNRHAKRRLTSPQYLEIYEKIFQNNAHLIQKTDNISLFAYSLETLSQHGYQFSKVSLDLANEKIINIETEYENRFKNLGFKINYLEASKELPK